MKVLTIHKANKTLENQTTKYLKAQPSIKYPKHKTYKQLFEGLGLADWAGQPAWLGNLPGGWQSYVLVGWLAGWLAGWPVWVAGCLAGWAGWAGCID